MAKLLRRVMCGGVALALVSLASPCLAQTPASPEVQAGGEGSATPYKLHVYANLLQIPTLVLSQREKLPPPIPRENFNITLDAGHVFHPTQMRMQGNDPIALAILLDAGGDQGRLLAKFRDALPRFAEKQLHPEDTVTLYAVDCKVMRSLLNVPADPKIIRDGVNHLLDAAGLHGKKNKPACGDSLPLWDAMVLTASALGQQPGRHVLLVISTGRNAKSQASFRIASQFFTIHTVAVFGMRDPSELPGNGGFPGPGIPNRYGTAQVGTTISGSPAEDFFALLCAENGGLVMKTYPEEVEKKLDEFAAFLRGRYILEFPRPDSGDPGEHLISVSVTGKHDYLVRSTGITFVMASPEQLNDPNTLRSQPSPAVYGTRKPLPHH